MTSGRRPVKLRMTARMTKKELHDHVALRFSRRLTDHEIRLLREVIQVFFEVKE